MSDTLERLEVAHGHLDDRVRQCVRSISNLAATLDVLGRVESSRLDDALEATREAWIELAEWLEMMAEIVDSARDRPDAEEAIQTLGDRLEQLEPPPGPPDEGEEGGEDRLESASPLHLLSAPYNILLEAEGEMFRERIKRPYRLIELKRLWSDFTYLGEDRVSSNFTERLGLLYEWTMRSQYHVPEEAPWHPSDLDSLRDLSDRAASVLAWDRDTIERRERERWVERVSQWVETAEANPETARHVSEMMMRFLTESPEAPDARVESLLERIETQEEFPDDVRRAAERARSQ